MNSRVNLSIIIFFMQIVFFVSLFIIPIGRCTQEIEFEVIASGDISGYMVEAYFVARTEDQWVEILKNHSAPFVQPEQWVEFWENRSGSIDPTDFEEVNFSEQMVICAFMGERRTAGYSLTVERVWSRVDQIHVEIVKNSPADDDAVATVLTYPYTFASIEKSEMEVVISVIGENGEQSEIIIPEIFSLVNLVVIFIAMVVVVVVLSRSDISKSKRAN